MPRIRIEFSKGEQVRFLSHLDLMKTFERAIRRADVPIAFSEGFNPHPKMNFASPLAVGVTSSNEYIDMELQSDMAPEEAADSLALALPPGIGIKKAKKIVDNAPALMAVVNRARYRVLADSETGLEQDEMEEKVADFLNLTEVNITKRTKKGPRQKNIRPGILSFAGSSAGSQIEFFLDTVISNEGNVRPEEVICAFKDHSGMSFDCDNIQIDRTNLFVEKEKQLLSPMDL